VMGGLAVLAVCATTMRAEDVSSGWYFGTDGGVSMMPAIRGLSSIAAMSSGGGGGSPTQTVHDPHLKLDVGTRLSLQAGYGFALSPKLTLGTELESGLIWNPLSSMTDGGGEHALGGNFYQVPILGNLVLSYHCGKWVPYIGAGGGVDVNSLDIYSRGGHPTVFSGSDIGPAVQGEAGLRYQLTDRSELGVGYKYLAAFSEKLNGFRASSVQSHAISLSYTYHF